MGRKTPYKPKKFESAQFYTDKNGKKHGDTSANIYMTMLLSQAWRDLTKNQQILYLYCKAQYYAEKRKPKHDEDNEFGNEWYFTMNKSKWCDLYGIYTENNKAQFRKDMAELINKGFIRCVACGWYDKQKTIYAYSSKWQKYGTSEFKVNIQDMTTHMRNKL